MEVHIVIGANYGDEGKGLITDGLSSRLINEGKRVCVVRFNGGAQAGHTVQTPEGVRHVFHHFGAGSLAGANTHLAQRFVVHPMLFRGEREELLKVNANTEISIDPRAIITLPMDVMINQEIEFFRSQNRHGSCGVGFGEAVNRNESGLPKFKLSIMDLIHLDRQEVYHRWNSIVNEYVPSRLKQLGLDDGCLDKYAENLYEEGFERFMEDCQYLLKNSSIALPCYIDGHDALILEGAQGLALDEEIGHFPYVTRSKTGLPWALEFLNQCSSTRIEANVWYLTRAYATRHGAGPLEAEAETMELPDFEDQTNVHNDFQGSIRLAPLDIEALERRINKDLDRSNILLGKVYLKTGIAVSCLDQMKINLLLSQKRVRETVSFSEWLKIRLGVENKIESWGPSRKTLNFY